MRLRKFPRVLYVYVDGDPGEEIFVCWESMKEALGDNSKRIATYRLEQVDDVTFGEPVIKPLKLGSAY